MTQKLTEFLTGAKNKDFATSTGTHMHALLQHVIIDDGVELGNIDIINTIKKHSDLLPFFVQSAQTEVAIAGNIHKHFVSRRIDRLLIKHNAKTIDFIDYKTDTDKNAFIEQYKHQLKEYAELLHSAYPNYKINGYILWLQDWTLDKII
jgi:ATP-dependent exoDNAse (exonuclease V) beta subunit